MKYSSLFRQIPDYPEKGILFEDVTTYWKDPDAFSYSIHKLAEHFKDYGINKVVGLEARGFVIAAPIAVILHAGFVPVRKPGRLPAEKISRSYTLEYGQNTLEMHKDAISKGDKVLLCDDVLATGGTLEAAESMIGELGGEIVGVALLTELVFLKGREKLHTKEIVSLYHVQG
ncbi:MAG: adenine phosphoribosyltransferase [Brevinema sp.]